MTTWRQLQGSGVREWNNALNDSGLWSYATVSGNIRMGRGLLMDLRVDGNEGIVLQFLIQERLEKRSG